MHRHLQTIPPVHTSLTRKNCQIYEKRPAITRAQSSSPKRHSLKNRQLFTELSLLWLSLPSQSNYPLQPDSQCRPSSRRPSRTSMIHLRLRWPAFARQGSTMSAAHETHGQESRCSSQAWGSSRWKGCCRGSPRRRQAPCMRATSGAR